MERDEKRGNRREGESVRERDRSKTATTTMRVMRRLRGDAATATAAGCDALRYLSPNSREA
jgi:hypothetical protein